MNERRRLPNRRVCTSLDLVHRDRCYTVSVGYFDCGEHEVGEEPSRRQMRAYLVLVSVPCTPPWRQIG